MEADHFSNKLKAMCAKSSRDNPRTYLPFWMHSMDTAGIIDKLFYRWMPASICNAVCVSEETEFRKTLHFLGLVHDIGKLTPAFQSKICINIEGQYARLMDVGIDLPILKYAEKSPHNIAGEAILMKFEYPEGIATIVGAHHGKPTNITDNPSENMEIYSKNYYGSANSDGKWDQLWKEWLDFALSDSGFESKQDLPELDMATQMLMTGIIIVGDWIASNSEFFPLINDEFSQAVYPDRVVAAWNALRFPSPWSPNFPDMSDSDFSREFGFEANMVQKEIISVAKKMNSPGLIILEAPMGIGKTEAALSAAEIMGAKFGEGGLYFGLPSQATANGLFPRILEWAQKQSFEDMHTINLMHGNKLLNPELQSIQKYSVLDRYTEKIAEDINQEGIYRNEWFEQRKTGLLSDFVVGTVDQLLLAALKRKHVMLRLLALTGKVVIVDECHAYDAYMNYYFDRVLSWLGKYNVPVVLLSATLPEKRKHELLEAYLNKEIVSLPAVKLYPSITWTENEDVYQRGVQEKKNGEKLQIGKLQEDKLLSFLEEQMKDGGCAGIIVNTVKKAQELAKMITHELPEYDVMVYHSAFTMEDRATLEGQLLRRLGKNSHEKDRDHLIVVGTQVLEQSLDIDFDLMITQLCPIDLLLQRIGRLHRHPRPRKKKLQKSQCLIMMPEGHTFDSGTGRVYDEWLLNRTYEYLEKQNNGIITIPDDIPVLVEDIYSTPAKETLSKKQNQDWRKYEQHMAEQKAKAAQWCLPKPDWDDTISGLLDVYIEGDESKAEAAVRDSGMSLEVIVLRKENEELVELVSIPHKEELLSLQEEPSAEKACQLLNQKIRLPEVFRKRWDDTCRDLMSQNTLFKVWHRCGLLKKELFLLLDGDQRAQLLNYDIGYSNKYGLSYSRKEDNE